MDVFGRVIREEKSEDLPRKLSKIFFFFFCKMRGLEAFIAFGTLPKAWRTMYVHQVGLMAT